MLGKLVPKVPQHGSFHSYTVWLANSAWFYRSQYAGLILALFGTFLSLIPFVFMKYGPALRARSKLAKEF